MSRSQIRGISMRRLLALLPLASGAAAGTITVEGTEQPQYTNVTNQLALTHGVTFLSTMPFVTFGANGVNTIGIYGTDPTSNPNANFASFMSPIELTFVSMNDGVTPAVVNGTISAVFGDAGGDTDGIRMRTYDINNSLIDTQTALAVSWGNIASTGVGIYRVVFDQSGQGAGTSDTFLDWVSYDEPVAVPEPSAVALLISAALWISSQRRRRA